MRASSLLLAALLLVLTPLVAHAHSSPPRALLALDRTVSGALVTGRNATVEYVVRNVGLTPATSVALKDLSFPASRFQVHTGAFRTQWASLAAGESASMRVVVTPLRSGELIVSPASVTYVDGGESRISRLAADEVVVVEDLIAFRRRTDRHVNEWGGYALAFLLLVVAPYGVSVGVEKGVPRVGVARRKGN